MHNLERACPHAQQVMIVKRAFKYQISVLFSVSGR